ncbi:MAG TPA: hypothetical protein VI076_10225 [Actinopolymorphaceae bacterium]
MNRPSPSSLKTSTSHAPVGDVRDLTLSRRQPRVGGGSRARLGGLVVRAGQTFALGTPTSGLRTYVAVRGGLDVPAVLGSRSTDTLSGLGPPPVTAGDRLRFSRR